MAAVYRDRDGLRLNAILTVVHFVCLIAFSNRATSIESWQNMHNLISIMRMNPRVSILRTIAIAIHFQSRLADCGEGGSFLQTVIRKMGTVWSISFYLHLINIH